MYKNIYVNSIQDWNKTKQSNFHSEQISNFKKYYDFISFLLNLIYVITMEFIMVLMLQNFLIYTIIMEMNVLPVFP